jgi:tetraacyldisaccharide 4'-kinase
MNVLMASVMILIRILLLPLYPIFWVVIQARILLYKYGFFRSHTFPSLVISVGNLALGGTGKTPLVIALANWLHDQDVKVAILTRGYGRRTSDTQLINLNKTKSDWENYGDEPFLMTKKLPEIPIAVDSNRIRGGKFLIQKSNPDVIILDDGYQHLAVNRDLNILLINSLNTVKELALLPLGNLREPWRSANRANMIIITKSNIFNPSPALLNKIEKTNIPFYKGENLVENFLVDVKNQRVPIDTVKNKKTYLLSAIGDQQSFAKTAGQLPVKVVGHQQFRDHYPFGQNDVSRILRKFSEHGADLIITTEKDLVRLENLLPDNFPVYAIPIYASIPKQLKERISDLLK